MMDNILMQLDLIANSKVQSAKCKVTYEIHLRQKVAWMGILRWC